MPRAWLSHHLLRHCQERKLCATPVAAVLVVVEVRDQKQCACMAKGKGGGKHDVNITTLKLNGSV